MSQLDFNTFVTTIYCSVCDFYASSVKKPLRSKGFSPKLTDQEIISIEIIGDFLGIRNDYQLWKKFNSFYLTYFPNMPSRTQFLKQSLALKPLKQLLFQHLTQENKKVSNNHFIIDSCPVSVRALCRRFHSTLFKDVAGTSYCAAKKIYFFGFRLHLLTNEQGLICDFVLENASTDERVIAEDIFDSNACLKNATVSADKGYISPNLENFSKKKQIHLNMPYRKNMKQNLLFNKLMYKKRKMVETVFSQLEHRFMIDKIRVRSLDSFCNRVLRKLISHCLIGALSVKLGYNLAMEKLVSF